MFHVINWIVVFSLLALWSLAAWAFHAIGAWTISNAGAFAGGVGQAEALRLPDWVAPWLPPELALAFTSMLSAFMPAVEGLLSQAPALAGGLSVAVWVAWAIGSIFLVVLGLVVTGLIAVLRRRTSIPAAPKSGRATMG